MQALRNTASLARIVLAWFALTLGAAIASSIVHPQSKALPAIDNAWVRASVPGQQATGAFMRITAKEPTQLVGASSPAAGSAEVHEMKMEGDVMKMRPAGVIELPVGKPFELSPGGHHLMLQDLKQTLRAGGTVPIALVFRNAKGVQSRVDLNLPVALKPPAR